MRRHQDQLRIRKGPKNCPQPEPVAESSSETTLPEDVPLDLPEPTQNRSESSSSSMDTETSPADNTPTAKQLSEPVIERSSVPESPVSPLRKVYPKRNQKPPNWFDGERTK